MALLLLHRHQSDRQRNLLGLIDPGRISQVHRQPLPLRVRHDRGRLEHGESLRIEYLAADYAVLLDHPRIGNLRLVVHASYKEESIREQICRARRTTAQTTTQASQSHILDVKKRLCSFE